MTVSAEVPPEDWRGSLLLTPGPLTTSLKTKEVMLEDFGSRDADFIEMTSNVRRRLVELVNGDESYVCVPVQGSGTFAIEAVLGTLLPPDGEILILVNGVYGRRMARICDYLGRSYRTLETPENVPNDVEALDLALRANPQLTHVAIVHCETTSGILNPLDEVAEVVARHGKSLIVDAMSTFGAIKINVLDLGVEAIAASSNKCLEGVPGVGFAIIRRSALTAASGNSPSLSLDLVEQWQGFESNGQWRFTPPTHVIAALDQALSELASEGGVAGRGRRYRQNCQALVEGLRGIGLESALDDEVQAPIITTWYSPPDARFEFEDFYQRLAAKGFKIYPGKLTEADTFRVGCIGRVVESDMKEAVTAIRAVIGEMGISTLLPD